MRMDRSFLPTLYWIYWTCDYLPMVVLKLTIVSTRGLMWTYPIKQSAGKRRLVNSMNFGEFFQAMQTFTQALARFPVSPGPKDDLKMKNS